MAHTKYAFLVAAFAGFFTALAGCISHTFGSADRHPSSVAGDAAVLGQLDQLATIGASELKGRIFIAKKDFIVFHYEHSHLPLDQVIRSDEPSLFQHAIAELNQIWDFTSSGNNHDTFGKGLYVSVDPLSTSMFGKPDFALYMIQVRKGLRYLYLPLPVDQDAFTFSPAFNEGVSKLGCGKGPIQDFTFMSVGTPACRTLGALIWQKLGVDAFAYFYPMGFATQGCTWSHMAMVLLNANKIAPADVRVVFPAIPSPDPDAVARKAIETIARNLRVDDYNPFFPWPSLTIDPNDHDLTWARQNLLDCQN